MLWGYRFLSARYIKTKRYKDTGRTLGASLYLSNLGSNQMNRNRLKRMRTLSRWKKRWRDEPERAESDRVKGTMMASRCRAWERKTIGKWMENWKVEMTPKEYDDRIKLLALNLNTKPSAVRLRLWRWKMTRFDVVKNLWFVTSVDDVNK